MVTQRERLKERGLVQISIWLTQDAADKLKQISEQRGISATKAVESAILAYDESILEQYSHSSSIPIDSILERLATLESRQDARADGDVDVLADRLTRQSAEIGAALAEIKQRLLALEKAQITPSSEAVPNPSSELKPAEIAATAVEDMPLFQESDNERVAAESETVAPGTESPDTKTDLDALVAAIPKTEFIGDNAARNRRILELHQAGLGSTQIAKAVTSEIKQCSQSSVDNFLKKNGIQPNKVGRWPKR